MSSPDQKKEHNRANMAQNDEEKFSEDAVRMSECIDLVPEDLTSFRAALSTSSGRIHSIRPEPSGSPAADL